MSANMEETPIFSEGIVKITNLRAMIGSKTYAISNVTSVNIGQRSPSPIVPIVLLLSGMFCLFASLLPLFAGHLNDVPWAIFFLALLAVVGGFSILRSAKPTYIVQLGSSSGETDALATRDPAEARRIADALNQAIISRG